MSLRAFLFSGIVNAPGLKSDTQRRAEDAKETGDLMMRADSSQDVLQWFFKVRRMQLSIDELIIFTHGDASRPGCMEFGSQRFDETDLDSFENAGLENTCGSNARIQFKTCYLAGSDSGEYFLARFASILLRRGGGAAGASNGYVVYHDWFHVDVNPFSSSVQALVRPGGATLLMNNTFLTRSALVERATALEEKLQLAGTKPGRVVRLNDLDEPVNQLNAARKILTHYREVNDLSTYTPISTYKRALDDSRTMARLEKANP